MAGGKTAAKRSKQKQSSDGTSAELKAVQAWVAEGLQLIDVLKPSALSKHVAEKCQGSSSRQVLLGGLYLLLKGWAKDAPADVQLQLEQLVSRAEPEIKAAAGQQPSLVMHWAVSQARLKIADACSDAAKQRDFWEPLLVDLHSLMTTTDPQQWLEQLQPPVDYPAAADDDAAAKGTQQQLAAALGAEVVHAYQTAKLKLQKEMDKEAMKLCKALKDLAQTVSVSGACADLSAAAAQCPRLLRLCAPALVLDAAAAHAQTQYCGDQGNGCRRAFYGTNACATEQPCSAHM